MRRLLRWLLVLGVFAAVIWCATNVKIGSRTAYGHLKRSHAVRSMSSWIEQRYDALVSKAPAPVKTKNAKPSASSKPPPPPAAEEAATARRVALLEDAAKQARPTTNPNLPEKTRIDERHSPRQKKALDDLVTSRVTRH